MFFPENKGTYRLNSFDNERQLNLFAPNLHRRRSPNRGKPRLNIHDRRTSVRPIFREVPSTSSQERCRNEHERSQCEYYGVSYEEQSEFVEYLIKKGTAADDG